MPESTVTDIYADNLERAVAGLNADLAKLDAAIDRQLAEKATIADILRTFYLAPLSASSLQPVLDLAVALNPDLRPVLVDRCGEFGLGAE